MRRKVFFIVILLSIILVSVRVSNDVSSQSEEILKLSEQNRKTIDKVEQDRILTEKVNLLIQQKQDQITQLIQSGDIASLEASISAIGVELTQVKTDFSGYQAEYRANKITAGQLEQRLANTQAQITALEAKYTVLQTAISTLDGSIEDKIKAQLGDIEKLKEDIKQQILNEINTPPPAEPTPTPTPTPTPEPEDEPEKGDNQ